MSLGPMPRKLFVHNDKCTNNNFKKSYNFIFLLYSTTIDTIIFHALYSDPARNNMKRQTKTSICIVFVRDRTRHTFSELRL